MSSATPDFHSNETARREAELLARIDEQLAQGPSLSESDGDLPGLVNRLQDIRSTWQAFLAERNAQKTASVDKDIPHNSQFGKYQQLQLIGHGGFGMVYSAFDPTLNRVVALKLAHRKSTHSPKLLGDIFKEAQAIAQLDHPNIVPIYDAGDIDGTSYLTLGLCTGPSLAQYIASRNEPVSIRTAVTIVRDATAGLSYSHQHGILHRDIKPANILLYPKATPDQGDFPFTAKLADFGLSKIAELSFQQSRSSVIVGTPAYIPPELAAGLMKAVGPQADIYSMGVVLYELLTQTVPYPVSSFQSVLDRTFQSQPESPRKRRKNIDSDLESICLKCLQREPERRYANGQQLLEDLTNYLEGKPLVGKLPSRAQGLADWLRRPERVVEAGTYSIIFNITMILWVIVNVMIVTPILTREEIKPSIIVTTLLIALIHAPLTYLGIRCKQFVGWSIYTGFFLSWIPLIMGCLTLAGLPGPFEGDYYSNPRLGIPVHFKQVLFGLLTVLCFCQAAYYGMAVLAYRRKRSRSQ